MNSFKQHWTLPKHNFYLCLWEFRTPKRTLYSSHWCDKLHKKGKKVRHHDWSWRARAHFQLSNFVSGQNLEKFLSDHEAREKVGRISAPVGVKLLMTTRPSRAG
jgi:hypothetical protein